MSRRLVFVGLETGTIDGIDSSARVVDLDACGFTPDGDDWADEVTVQNLAETYGVPVADLWAAYEWRREMQKWGMLEWVEDYVARRIVRMRENRRLFLEAYGLVIPPVGEQYVNGGVS